MYEDNTDSMNTIYSNLLSIAVLNHHDQKQAREEQSTIDGINQNSRHKPGGRK